MIVEQRVAQARYDVCKQCDKFIITTKQCGECWCFMPAKVKFINNKCPLDKWKDDK
jgi:hypothetical protein